ncbi:MAG: hypothetical protein AB1598_01555 [Thermodesulfobacteriota bacterium]
MTYRISKTLLFIPPALLFTFLFQLYTAVAEETKCSNIEKDIVEETTHATASLFANESNKPGSVRYESGAILQKAQAGIPNAEKPADMCPAGCELVPKPVIVFKAVPQKFLTSYSDYAKCQALLEQTEKTPFEYDKKFGSMSEVQDWFSNFSRGKGTDGQDLYKRCSGQCSPQYEFFISDEGGELTLDADVVCGHARDKSNNMYDISYSYQWVCEDK